jgi:NADPH-dependent 2,4-dienoyl-CoA reductase/sulfur reductase-like enzyme
VADVVVVGAGLAGARMCALLRSGGFAGSITLLGAESDPPYDRPPLTKDPEAEVDLRPAMGIDVWAHADDVRLAVAAGALGTGPRRPGPSEPWVVSCSDGSEVGARAVVLASGAEPVLPMGWSRPGVHLLHTRGQAQSFWSAVRPGTRVLIVGGGWIGCEAASTAAARGAQVVLVEAGARVLAGQVPGSVADRIQRWLIEAGVRVRTGRTVTNLDAEADDLAVGGRVPDLVLVALGVRPATSWLVDVGLDRAPSGAVLVDEYGRTNQAGVFAVGDCASRWSPRRSAHLPGGHWTEALNAPEQVAPAVARWVSGHQRPDDWTAVPSEPHPDPIPYIFSDIAGRRLLLLGDPLAGRLIWRAGEPNWTCFSVDHRNRLVGLCTVGRPRDLVSARRAMLADPSGTPYVDVGSLGDPQAAPGRMFPQGGD